MNMNTVKTIIFCLLLVGLPLRADTPADTGAEALPID